MGSSKPLIDPATAESIVAKRGRATANGAGDGSTLVDTDLTEANDYWNDMTLFVLSGASDGQSRDITDFAGGTLTVSPAFSNQILLGVRYFILPIKPSFAEIADLDVDIANIVQQVTLTGHPANSIGKILYDFYITRLTAARCGYLANINNANLATIADISTLTATEIGYLANINNANLATIADISSLTATEIGYLAELAAANIPSDVDAIKAKTDLLPAANTDQQSEWIWDTATNGTNETAMGAPDLAGETRRRYTLFLDMTAPAADGGAWTTCTIKVKVDIDGTNFRTVDKKVLARADVAAAEEPGVNIDVPAVAKNVRITMQFDVALADDATIYYCLVTEALE